MNRSQPPVRQGRGFGAVVLAAVLFALIQSFVLIAPILLSLLLVILISLALDPLVRRIAGWTGGRTSATGLLAITFALVLALTGWAFLGPMTKSVTKLSEQLPRYWEKFQKPLIKIEQQAVRSEQKMQAEVKTEIAHTAPPESPKAARRSTEPPQSIDVGTPGNSLRAGFTQMLKGLAGGFAGAAFNAAQILVVAATVLFGVLFTLIDPVPVFGILYSIVPEVHHDRTRVIAKRISDFLPGWAGATALGMLTIGSLVFLLMWPLFGLMDALLLGMIAGIFEAFPYFGPILSSVPALLFGLIQGGNTPLWVALGYIAVQVVENNVILPYIMAKEMKLHPVAVIFATLICVTAFGVLGVVIAAPLVAIGQILYDELYRERFLPTVTKHEVDRMVTQDLGEKRLPSTKR